MTGCYARKSFNHLKRTCGVVHRLMDFSHWKYKLQGGMLVKILYIAHLKMLYNFRILPIAWEVVVQIMLSITTLAQFHLTPYRCLSWHSYYSAKTSPWRECLFFVMCIAIISILNFKTIWCGLFLMYYKLFLVIYFLNISYHLIVYFCAQLGLIVYICVQFNWRLEP